MKDTNLLTANLGKKIAIHSHTGSNFQLRCPNDENAAVAERLCNRVLNCRKVNSGQRYISFCGGTAMNIIVEEGNRQNSRRNYVLQVFQAEPDKYTGKQKQEAKRYASVVMRLLTDPSISVSDKALLIKPGETDKFTKLLPVIAQEMAHYLTLETPVRLELTEDISSRPDSLDPEQTYLFTALLSQFKSLSVKNYIHCISMCTKASPITFQSLLSDYEFSELKEIWKVVFTDDHRHCKPLTKAVDLAGYLTGISEQLNNIYPVFTRDEIVFLCDYLFNHINSDPKAFTYAHKAADLLRGQAIPEEYLELMDTTVNMPNSFSAVKTRILIAWINGAENQMFETFMNMIWDSDVNTRKYIFVRIKDELSTNPLWDFLTDELKLLNEVCCGRRKLSVLSNDDKFLLTMLCIDGVRLPGIRLSLRFRGRKQREDAAQFVKYVLEHDNPNHRESHLFFCPAYRTAYRSYISDKRADFRRAIKENFRALIGTYL